MSSPLPSSSPESAILMTYARKSELLEIARLSRIKWINQGIEKELRRFIYNSAPIASTADEIQRVERVKAEIPVIDAIQDVLGLFSDLIDDGEHVDVDSIISYIELDVGSNNDYENHYKDDCDFDYHKNDVSPLPVEESSATIAYDYVTFLRKLRHSSSKDIVSILRQHVTKFQANYQNTEILEKLSKSSYRAPLASSVDSIDITATIDINNTEMNKIGVEIWQFIDSVLNQMRQSPAWLNETNEHWELTEEYLEKFLFQKLHQYLFATTTDDIVKDQRLYQRIQSLSFIRPEHLDLHRLGLNDREINMQHSTSRSDPDHDKNTTTLNNSNIINHYHDHHPLTESMKELQSMMIAQSPVGKLNHLKLCTQALTDALIKLKSQSSTNSTDIFHGLSIANTTVPSSSTTTVDGVDVYLPLMIYLVKECNPSHLYSNIVYLQRYTPTSKLNSECGYLLTYFVSAVHFLETADSQTLAISPEEFNASIRKCYKEMNNMKYHHYRDDDDDCTSNNNNFDGSNVNGPDSGESSNKNLIKTRGTRLPPAASASNVGRVHCTSGTATGFDRKKELILLVSPDDSSYVTSISTPQSNGITTYDQDDHDSENLTNIEYSDIFDSLFLKSKGLKSLS